jgi:hypothetical protein
MALSRLRASWRFGSGLTARQRWSIVKGFFTFCESQSWIDDSPAGKLKSLTAAAGNRTAIFTDEQYASTVNATFLELMRWSGMDLIDAVQFTPNLVDKDGVLRYRRQKTDVLATVPLPDNLVILLRDIPLERDSVGPAQPFRQRDCTVGSAEHEYECDDCDDDINVYSAASAGARRRYRMGERQSILFARESVRPACSCAFAIASAANAVYIAACQSHCRLIIRSLTAYRTRSA